MSLLDTRLTRAFGLAHPLVLAPMAGVAGGALAAAVARAGGLALLGGGYGDADWLAREWALAGDAPIGVGFITWRLGPALLEQALARQPRAVMLSFGDPAPFAPAIHAARAALICQVQELDHVRAALDAGAQVIVAQGAEAGGHGARRGTMTLVPEVADLLAARAPKVLLLAAGGVADGRGLAAALALGADGALIGTRLAVSAESLVPEGFRRAAVAASGDGTLRTRAVDAVRGLDWPEPFDIRVLASDFTDEWHHDADYLRSPEAAPLRARFQLAQAQGDARHGAAVLGEAVGLIHDAPPAATILSRITAQAAAILSSRGLPGPPA